MRLDPIPKERRWLLAAQIGCGLLTVVLGFLYLAGMLPGMLYLVLAAAIATGVFVCIPYDPEKKQPRDDPKLRR